MLKQGDMAPGFELIASDGESARLSDFRGQRVILYFYPRADTPGCTKQACGFRDNFSTIEAAGATVIGVSPDTPEALAKWKKARNFQFTMLSDPEHEVAEAYGVWGQKSMFGRKFMGIIRSHFVIGPDGRIEDVQVNVSPQDSVSRALNALS